MDWKTANFIRSLAIDREIAPGDTMYKMDRHYFYVGQSDLLAILNVLNIRSSYCGGDKPVGRILDFGCGFGRVARVIRAAFPDAEISVTDLEDGGVDWCVKKYGCVRMPSEMPENYFDLVWLGSVFTHLPEKAAEILIKQLRASLRANGVLVFTTQGRFSIERLKRVLAGVDPDVPHSRYNLNEQSAKVVIEGFESREYGYVDYPGNAGYGVCCAAPAWYARRMLDNDQFIQILLQEKGADNHQDVMAYMRASLMDIRKGELW